MDSDGSYKQHISFSSASEKYVTDFYNYLQSIGIKSKIGKIGNYAHNLTIPALYRLNFIKQIGVDNPKKKSDMIQLFEKIRLLFKGLNKENLFDGMYFNLLKIPTLSVKGLGEHLKNNRRKRTIQMRSKELGISTKLYAEYEQEKRAISINTLQKILELNNKALIEFLGNQINLLYQISTSKLVKLPIRVTSDIIEVMNILEPKKNYVKILIDNDTIKTKVEQFFGLKINEQRIESRIIVKFLSTFGIYEKPNISDLEIESILVL